MLQKGVHGTVHYSPNIKPFRSILCDWIIIFGLLMVTAILESPNRNPYYQCIPGWTKDSDGKYTICGDTRDPELEYPYKPNTISSTLLPILTFGPWIFSIIFNIFILYCLDPLYRCKSVLKNIEILLRMMLFSCLGTEALVSIIKFSVGRPRPNFYHLMEDADRTESDHKQSRMSFPSGHSSLSFSLLFLLSLNLFNAMNYVQIRFRNQNKNTLQISINNPHSYFYLKIWWILRYYLLFSVLLVFIPTFLAIYIACTRITDYWHHYGDVAVGALLGIAGSFISFIIFKDELLYPININNYKQSLISSSDDHNQYEQQQNIINTDHSIINRTDESSKLSLEINDGLNVNDATTMENRIIDFNKTQNINNLTQNVQNRSLSSKDPTDVKMLIESK